MNNQVPNTDPSLSAKQFCDKCCREIAIVNGTQNYWRHVWGEFEEKDFELLDRLGCFNCAQPKLPAAVSEVDGGTEMEDKPYRYKTIIETKGGQRKTYGCDTQAEVSAILSDMEPGAVLISINGPRAVAPQGTVEGETLPKLEATYFVHKKDGSMEVSTDPYRRDYVSYQDFCVIRELLFRPPVTQEIPAMDVTKDDIYEAERRLYLRKRGNDPLRLDLMAEIVCRERQWQQTLGKVAESVAPPSVAVQEFEDFWNTYRPKFDSYSRGESAHKESAKAAWNASKAALPVAVSGEGSGVPARQFKLPDDEMLAKQQQIEQKLGITLEQAARTWAWNEWNIRASEIGREYPDDMAHRTALSLAEDLYITLRLKAALSSPLQGWIDCKQRMPTGNTNVLCCDADGDIHLAWYRPDGGKYTFDCDTYGLSVEEATHWMPLPAPPDTKGGS